MSTQRIMENFSYWRFAIFKGFNGWLIAVGMVIFATDVDWAHFTAFQKCRFIGAGILAGSKFLEAFIDQTVSNLKRNKNPFDIEVEQDPKENEKTNTRPPLG